MSLFQASYTQAPEPAVLGQMTDLFESRRVRGKVARGPVKAGYGCFKVETVGGSGTSMLDPGEVLQTPSPVLTIDVDAIGTLVSSASIQTLTTFNGVVGLTEMQPARKLQITFDASTDWDATVATLTGVNHLGQTVSESIAVATSTAPVTTNTYRSVKSFVIPAQTGAGGTATFGVTAVTALTIADFKGVAVRQDIKTTNSSSAIYGYPGLTAAQLAVVSDYVDAESVPVLSQGGIWVFTEQAVVDGDPVFVRIAAGAGGSVLGSFRKDADTATCVLVVGASFRKDRAAGLAHASFSYAN